MRNSRSGAPSNLDPTSSRSSLRFLSVNGTVAILWCPGWGRRSAASRAEVPRFFPAALDPETWRAGSHGSAVVGEDLDVVPVGVQDERAVVARVVDGPLAGSAVILVARGERGGVERPHGRVV